MGKTFQYSLDLQWVDHKGTGTSDSKSYDRSYIIRSSEKKEIHGSSDPAFKGDSQKWNPEELLLASLSSCHMLWYLHFCAQHKIVVTEYQDHPIGIMETDKTGKGGFVKATLKPYVTITESDKIDLAEKLHLQAHDFCFIAHSVSFEVQIEPRILVKTNTH